MLQVKKISELRDTLHSVRQQCKSIGFVPTMGNLHQGHLRLVDESRLETDFVVVSIFVNPTQFGQDEDFTTYPRTLVEDLKFLDEHQVDLVFIPEIDEIYPSKALTSIEVAGISDLHCGAFRPGHFKGVATVVCKLLNMVQPEVIFLGKKDYQQLIVIKNMMTDLNMNFSVKGVSTVRDKNGLALSSRNSYLTEQQRREAPKLYQSLIHAKQLVQNGLTEYEAIEKKQVGYLLQNGFKLDYFSICQSHTLQPAKKKDKNLVILTAARLGKTRLIDNLEIVA